MLKNLRMFYKILFLTPIAVIWRLAKRKIRNIYQDVRYVRLPAMKRSAQESFRAICRIMRSVCRTRLSIVKQTLVKNFHQFRYMPLRISLPILKNKVVSNIRQRLGVTEVTENGISTRRTRTDMVQRLLWGTV